MPVFIKDVAVGFLPALIKDVAVGTRRLASVRSSVTRRRIAGLARREPPLTLLYRHGELVRQLMSGKAAMLTSFGWKSTTKYLRPYMSLSLDHVARRELLLTQYAFLCRNFNRDFFVELGNPQRPLWKHGASDCYSIWLTATNDSESEGDLALLFKASDQLLYQLLFGVGYCPTDNACGVAVLIACLQGRRGYFEEIREATRACGDISPAQLLLSAAEGLAMALRIATICGVSDAEQLSKHNEHKEGFWFEYDIFWEAQSGERRGGWYQLPVPLPHKPLSLVSESNRPRTRRKRQFRGALRDTVRAAVETRYSPNTSYGARATAPGGANVVNDALENG